MRNFAIPILVYIMFSTANTFAATNGVAKVLKVRGDISFKVPTTGKSGKLIKDMWLSESAVISSGPKSFAKILFIDKSRLTVGPKSEVVIKKFDKKSAGVIGLLTGKIRSQVTKNYMDMENKGKSKLFITTKNAAMGVRGTDFQVNYNAVNRTTDLITLSGSVAFNRLSSGSVEVPKVSELESIVSSKSAVMVTKGTFSRASEQEDRPTKAYSLNALQARKLKTDNDLLGGGEEKKREIIPPGITTAEMMNDGSALDEILVVVVEQPAVLKPEEVSLSDSDSQNIPLVDQIFVTETDKVEAREDLASLTVADEESESNVIAPVLPSCFPDCVLPSDRPEISQFGTVIININLQ